MSGSKILIIIAQRNFRDEEFSIPKQIFEDKGYSVEVASITTEEAKGKFGLKVKPNLSIEEAIDELEKYAAIVFSGGPGALDLIKREEVMEIIRKARDEYKIIGAICVAPVILANSGILRNKDATVWSSEINQETILEIEDKGARYINKDVVVDGDIVTANGPEAAKKFAEKIIERLE